MDTIRQLRERKGLYQKDIAEAVGVQTTCVSSWERGRTEPNARQMVQLCAVLECTAEELLGMGQ